MSTIDFKSPVKNKLKKIYFQLNFRETWRNFEDKKIKTSAISKYEQDQLSTLIEEKHIGFINLDITHLLIRPLNLNGHADVCISKLFFCFFLDLYVRVEQKISTKSLKYNKILIKIHFCY